jgi:hypothetical protein
MLRSCKAFSSSEGRSGDLLADHKAAAVASKMNAADPIRRYRRLVRDMIGINNLGVTATAAALSANTLAERGCTVAAQFSAVLF